MIAEQNLQLALIEQILCLTEGVSENFTQLSDFLSQKVLTAIIF